MWRVSWRSWDLSGEEGEAEGKGRGGGVAEGKGGEREGDTGRV